MIILKTNAITELCLDLLDDRMRCLACRTLQVTKLNDLDRRISFAEHRFRSIDIRVIIIKEVLIAYHKHSNDCNPEDDAFDCSLFYCDHDQKQKVRLY